MLYARPRISPRKWDAHNSLGFWDTNGSLSIGQPTRSSDNKKRQKKKTWQIVDFALRVEQRVKLTENEKRDKYVNLTREVRKLWNIKVTVIPIVSGALGTFTKGLIQGIGNKRWVKTIQTKELLRSTRMLRRVLETWRDLLSLRLQWKTIS